MGKINFYSIEDLKKDINKVLDVLDKNRPKDWDTFKIEMFFNSLKSDIIIAVEENYVDYIYRDAFYNFYATKFKEYSRFCLKLSLFKSTIVTQGIVDLNTGIVDFSKKDLLLESYLGFLILRPFPAIIGRNIIAVEAKTNDKIKIIQTLIKSSSIGLKMEVSGFPHSSQDGQVMTCAETTVWCIMEYFGYRYPIHKIVLPSHIKDVLRNTTYERQWPSTGLYFHQISNGLRGFGMAPKTYGLANYDRWGNYSGMKPDIKETLIGCIESGLPLALSITSSEGGHAVCAIGHEDYYLIPKVEIYQTDDKGNVVYDGSGLPKKSLYSYNRSIDKIVVNDDNMPPYQEFDINKPCFYYTEPPFDKDEWNNAFINIFVVPLPERVHMFPDVAIKFSQEILMNIAEDKSIYRTFLASSRSYKNHLMSSRALSNANKNKLLEIEFPRFIWVTEFELEDDYKQGEATGLLILDATEFSKSRTAVVVYIDKFRNFAYNNSNNQWELLNLPDEFRVNFYDKNLY